MGTSVEDWETLQSNIDNALMMAGYPVPEPRECLPLEPEPGETELILGKIDSALAVGNIAIATFDLG